MIDEAFGSLPVGASASVEPFTFDVPAQDIEDFKVLLKLSKLAPETWYNRQEGGIYGVSRNWLDKAKNAWLEFNWREHEAQMNSVPNFKLTIVHPECGPITLHFAALFSSRKDAIPVIFMHSWPGAFSEYLPVMHMLARKHTHENMPYHMIVPSMPGFGPSTAPLEVEKTYNHAAEILHQLMMDLGFRNGYVAQGGDVGSSLARIMAARFEECKAIHITMLMAENAQQAFSDEPLSSHDQVLMERMNNFMTSGISYALFNGFRPSTAGLVVSSNPLALLAYIGEKLVEWVDHRYPLPLDTILGIVSFYWYTSTFPRCLFQYPDLATSFTKGTSMELPMAKDKPFGYSSFAGDIVAMPYSWAKKAHPSMVSFSAHEKGGHFPALEQPVDFLQAVDGFLSGINVTNWKWVRPRIPSGKDYDYQEPVRPTLTTRPADCERR